MQSVSSVFIRWVDYIEELSRRSIDGRYKARVEFHSCLNIFEVLDSIDAWYQGSRNTHTDSVDDMTSRTISSSHSMVLNPLLLKSHFGIN